MLVESVSAAKRGKSRVILALEDGRRIPARAEDVLKLGIRAGSDIDGETEVKLAAALKKASARATAVNVLSYKAYSKQGLKKRLTEKGISEEEADDSADWLEGMGLLNDNEYGSAIRDHYLKKGYGTSRIRQELFKRGIGRELAAELTEGLDTEGAISRYIESRLKGKSPDRDEIRRLTDALLRRGHSYEEIRAALSRYIDETDDF